MSIKSDPNNCQELAKSFILSLIRENGRVYKKQAKFQYGGRHYAITCHNVIASRSTGGRWQHLNSLDEKALALEALTYSQQSDLVREIVKELKLR